MLNLINCNLMKSVVEVENLSLPTIELNHRNALSLLSGILDEQINTLKIQSISNWERNHDYDLNGNEALIDDLVRKKEAIKAFLKQFSAVDTKFDIQFNFTICAK